MDGLELRSNLWNGTRARGISHVDGRPFVLMQGVRLAVEACENRSRDRDLEFVLEFAGVGGRKGVAELPRSLDTCWLPSRGEPAPR